MLLGQPPTTLSGGTHKLATNPPRLDMSSLSSSSSSSPPSASPLFKFGIVADIQFCDCPDGFSFDGVPRYYRHSLSTASACASSFASRDADFAINLGDIIDGKCSSTNPNSSSSALAAVQSSLSHFSKPWYHSYGNHELYNFGRKELQRLLNIPFVDESSDASNPALVAYYSFKPHPGFKVIMLDSYDLSILGRPAGSEKFLAAQPFMSNNPNYKLGQGNSPIGLLGLDQRFMEFNGGFGEKQLAFLAAELASSAELKEKVILCSHQPLHPSTSPPICLPWNYGSVLSSLRQAGGGTCPVVATLSGHTHDSAYYCSDGNDATAGALGGGGGGGGLVHHLVFKAALESKPPVHSFAFAEVFHDRLVITGEGDEISRVLPFY